MSEFRVWFAARDLYHCAFRMLRLLSFKVEAVPVEKLRILDMLLMYPALTARMRLPNDVREQLRALKIPPEKAQFVHLPGTASIWQDLQLYQSAALKELTGRGLLKREALVNRYAALELEQLPNALVARVKAANAEQPHFMDFLTGAIARLPVSGPDNIFKRAGIPARGPVL
ncbi:MAG: ABC-three component system middle component 5 [Janthinobacterium lividum]